MTTPATSVVGEDDEGTVRAAYPGPTRDQLRELKRRYDPDNLFRLNHNIPPADPLPNHPNDHVKQLPELSCQAGTGT